MRASADGVTGTLTYTRVLIVPAIAGTAVMPSRVSRQPAGSPAHVALVCTPAVTTAVTATSSSAAVTRRGVVHVRRGAHQRRLVAGEADLGADRLVIGLLAGRRSCSVRAGLVPGALAALVVDEMPHVVDAHRRSGPTC